MRMRSAAVPAALLVLLGCSGRRTTSGVHPAPLPMATTAVASAFNSLEIPLAVVDDYAGFVASGGFAVEHAWGGEQIASRIDCGLTPEGTPRAGLGRVHLSIEAHLERNDDPAANSRTVTEARRATDVKLTGRGEITLDDGTHGCGLTDRFMRRILAAAGVEGATQPVGFPSVVSGSLNDVP
jgi:hypothetical protein